LPSPSRHASAADDPVRLYLNDIGRHPLLTKEREAELGELVQVGLAARATLDAAAATGERLSAERSRALRRAVRAGEDAETTFVQSNLRLVVSIAKKYQHTGLPLLDLIQEGNLGLIHSVGKFDHRKGFKFSTYATWWIRQAITRGAANAGRTIRMPIHAEDLLRAHDKTLARLEVELGRKPTRHEIAEEMSVSAERLEDVLGCGRVVASIDDRLGEDSDTTLGDLTAVAADDPASDALDEAVRADVQAGLRVLNDRERRIVELRFGLDCGQPRTLDDVAALFELTRERIRQIEVRALSKLRHPTNVGAFAELAS
jgi:RNA polymerase sigma factor (sigma-70 family)